MMFLEKTNSMKRRAFPLPSFNLNCGGKVGFMKFLDNICLILVIVGALNWGSIGLFGLDFVGYLFGGQLSVASRIIFALVGLAGLWTITLLFKDKVPNSER